MVPASSAEPVANCSNVDWFVSQAAESSPRALLWRSVDATLQPFRGEQLQHPKVPSELLSDRLPMRSKTIELTMFHTPQSRWKRPSELR